VARLHIDSIRAATIDLASNLTYSEIKVQLCFPSRNDPNIIRERCRDIQSGRTRNATVAAYALGSEAAFASSIALIGLWLLPGHSSRYSDRWELLINTVTNVVTFLMVFLLQNMQNRDTQRVNERLDRNKRDKHLLFSSRLLLPTVSPTLASISKGRTPSRKKHRNMRTAVAWRCTHKAKDIDDGRFLGH
jgi:hypothetical protein